MLMVRNFKKILFVLIFAFVGLNLWGPQQAYAAYHLNPVEGEDEPVQCDFLPVDDLDEIFGENPPNTPLNWDNFWDFIEDQIEDYLKEMYPNIPGWLIEEILDKLKDGGELDIPWWCPDFGIVDDYNCFVRIRNALKNIIDRLDAYYPDMTIRDLRDRIRDMDIDGDGCISVVEFRFFLLEGGLPESVRNAINELLRALNECFSEASEANGDETSQEFNYMLHQQVITEETGLSSDEQNEACFIISSDNNDDDDDTDGPNDDGSGGDNNGGGEITDGSTVVPF